MFRINYKKTNNETIDLGVYAVVANLERIINKNEEITTFQHGMYEGRIAMMNSIGVITNTELHRISKEFFRLCYHMHDRKAVEK